MAKQDIHLRLLDPSVQTFGSNFTLDFAATVKVDGKYKLANRWVKRFLTPKGSHPLRLQEGTEFAFLQGGNVIETGAIESSILEHIEDATNQIRAEDSLNPGGSADEKIQTVNLLKFSAVNATKIEFWVEIIAVSGASVQRLIPYAAS